MIRAPILLSLTVWLAFVATPAAAAAASSMVTVTRANSTTDGSSCAAAYGCQFCQDLDQQRGPDNKWKSYDFVMDNCLVKRFINSSGLQMDFYSLMGELELASQRVDQLYGQIEERQLEAHSDNMIKRQVESKAIGRRINQHHLSLTKLMDGLRLKVTLAESDINDFVERCSLGSAGQSSGCSQLLEATLSNTRALCIELEAQLGLMRATIASYELSNPK